MTHVFSTNRGVREFYAKYLDKDTIVPKAITISEFESKAIFVKGRSFIDDDTRFLLLKEASNFNEFKTLQFNTDFLVFLNHSQFLFKFFEETANENISLQKLKEFDTYALYNEHLDVLETLRLRYIRLLDDRGYVDKINLNQCYNINEDYVKNLGDIHFRLDGFLNMYEIGLIEKCSALVPFYISFDLNEYNQKIQKTFEKLGYDLYIGHNYKLDLTNKKVLTCKKLQKSSAKTEVKIFNTRISQIGFVNSSIQRFIQDGLKAENIVVVLPDEEIAQTLKEFDTCKNLNFAMGFSLKNSKLYKRLEAIELYFAKTGDEEKARLKRLEVSDELLQEMRACWSIRVKNFQSVKNINKILLLDEQESENELLKEEIFRFSKFCSNLSDLSLEQTVKLFINRLIKRSTDDISGGKITVMGVLETRGCSYDGVIVMDFSDDFVPRRNQKDLFLNTKIRKNIGLPTKKDRENLQKYYYNHLFSSAKKVAICSVANESTMPSRFLDELHIKYDEDRVTKAYNSILFNKSKNYIPCVKEIKGISYKLTSSALSATKLNTLLTCKRKFYFRYIQKLQEPKNILTSSNATVGKRLHQSLENIFTKDKILVDEDEIMKSLEQDIKSNFADELEEFTLDTWIKTLDKFVKNEIKRYKNGYRIQKSEVMLEKEFEDFHISGKIDRIDTKDGKLFVIDYKSGNVDKLINQKLENTTDFQLEFYYLLASSLGDVEDVYYYDLSNAKLIKEELVSEKTEKLKQILKEFKKPITTFELCEKHANCTYCPYIKLCLRDL